MSDLPNWRKQLDELDAEIIRLMARRFEVTRKIGEHKAAGDLPVRDEVREQQQLERIQELARDQGVDAELTVRVMQAIIDESAKQQMGVRSN